MNMLTADGVHVNVLKNDVNLSTVGPYFVGINFTNMTVSIVVIRLVYTVFLSHFKKMLFTCQGSVTSVHILGFIFCSTLSKLVTKFCKHSCSCAAE